jgi:hypothetical protein
MDVVKTNIEKIGGIVDLSSHLGEDTTVKIKIPLTDHYSGSCGECDGEGVATPQVSLLELLRFLGESKEPASLNCSVEQALAFTFRMLGEDPAGMTDDVRDVLGELANVVGRNLKSLARRWTFLAIGGRGKGLHSVSLRIQSNHDRQLENLFQDCELREVQLKDEIDSSTTTWARRSACRS